MNRSVTEARPREFCARFARCAPSIAARRRGPRATRRILLLAAAVALPAMAQAHLASDSAQAEWAAPDSSIAPFRIARNIAASSGLTIPALPVALSRMETAGPAARALRPSGTLTDRMRAQYCLTSAIYYEAGAEDAAGQRAVAQVVLNRVAHPAFPATVCGVVFQGSDRSTGCQFSFTCDGSMARAPARLWWDRAARTARAALAGAVYAPVGLATHYHTVQVHPYWADTLDGVGTIGAHRFYRWRGAAGQPHAFVFRYVGGEPAPALHGSIFGQDVTAAATADAGPALPDSVAGDGGLALAAFPGESVPPVPVSTAAAATDRLGRSGQVRREFEGAGQWLKPPHATADR